MRKQGNGQAVKPAREQAVGVVNRQGQGDADVVVFETAAGLGDQDDQLVLYIVSLFDVAHVSGEVISGDALLVRPRGTSDQVLLSAILGCEIDELAPLIARSGTGTWMVREVAEIDGHRLRFESN